MTVFPIVPVGELVASGEAELKTGPFGTQLKASEYTEHGTPVINVRNIGFGSIKPDKLEFISPSTRDRLSSHVLKSGDIVFGRKGAVERHVFIRQEQNGWFQGSDCLRLRFTSHRVEPLFASYYFLTLEHQRWMMNQCSHGATMASLNQGILERIALPLPSVTVQKRIAAVLSAYDELIENSQRRIKILESMARGLYREWFVHFRFPGYEGHPRVASALGQIPEGWEVKKLGDLIGIDKGVSYNGAGLTEVGNPMVNLKNIIAGGGFRRDATKPYSGDFRPRHTVMPGDIVLANTDLTQAGNVVASVALIPRFAEDHPILISHHLFAVRLSVGLLALFVYHLMLEGSFRGFAKGYALGTTVLGLPKEGVLDFVFALPSQDLIADFVKYAAPLHQQIETLNDRIDNLRRTRDLLLPRLLSGQIEVEAT